MSRKQQLRILTCFCLGLAFVPAFAGRPQSKSVDSTVARAARMLSFEDEQTGLWGFKDQAGKIIIPPQFIFAFDFTGEIAAVGRDDGLYYIDESGKVLSMRPYIFDNGPDEFHEGLARYRLGSKIGFLNEAGEVVIEPMPFDFVSSFSDSLAAVCAGGKKVKQEEADEHPVWEGGKWGYVDRKGEIVIPMKFEAAKPFAHGEARVKSNGKWVVINKRGEVIE